ncbi:hypothetical protein PC121_g7138 [Phytophthora cactorum]|nr:hypothetical protein PC121_g7138 [Phytophthora cactorum]
MLMEYHLDHHERPYLLSVVQLNWNQTPVRSQENKCPMALFLALPPTSSLDIIARPEVDASLKTIDLECVADSLDELRVSLPAMHREVVNVKEKKRLYDLAAAKGSLPTLM